MTSSGTLLIISTPIGNADDITLRALKALRAADLVVCTDEVEGLQLLQALELETPILELTDVTAEEDLDVVIGVLDADQQVALITGGGTPLPHGVSLALVQQCIARGIVVEVVPGAAAFLTGIVRSGFDGGSFVMAGEVQDLDDDALLALMSGLADEERTIVALATQSALASVLTQISMLLPDRRAYVGCALTTASESHHYGTTAELAQKFTEKHITGDAVVCLQGAAAAAEPNTEEDMGYNESYGPNRRDGSRGRRHDDDDDQGSRQPLSNESRMGYGTGPSYGQPQQPQRDPRRGDRRDRQQQGRDRGQQGRGGPRQGGPRSGNQGRPPQGEGRPRRGGGEGRPMRGGGEGRPMRGGGEGRPMRGGGEGRPMRGGGEGRPMRGGGDRPYGDGGGRRGGQQGGNRQPRQGRPQGGRPYGNDQRDRRGPQRPMQSQRPPIDDESWQPMTNESAFLKQPSGGRGGRGGGMRGGQGGQGQRRRGSAGPRQGGQGGPRGQKRPAQPFSANPRSTRTSNDVKRGTVFTRDGYISSDFTEQKKPTEKKMRSRRKKSNDHPED